MDISEVKREYVWAPENFTSYFSIVRSDALPAEDVNQLKFHEP